MESRTTPRFGALVTEGREGAVLLKMGNRFEREDPKFNYGYNCSLNIQVQRLNWNFGKRSGVEI